MIIIHCCSSYLSGFLRMACGIDLCSGQVCPYLFVCVNYTLAVLQGVLGDWWTNPKTTCEKHSGHHHGYPISLQRRGVPHWLPARGHSEVKTVWWMDLSLVDPFPLSYFLAICSLLFWFLSLFSLLTSFKWWISFKCNLCMIVLTHFKGKHVSSKNTEPLIVT